ncbi:Uncharacterised protein [Vibrio cholerae]|nr:Uncharacterised protein [Vibrio cholerae]CSI59711.1 Uncharacterised protein [Vibrio cholerae]
MRLSSVSQVIPPSREVRVIMSLVLLRAPGSPPPTRFSANAVTTPGVTLLATMDGIRSGPLKMTSP